MTFGQLFTIMNPNVTAIENGTCVWLFFENGINHYTIATKWWDKEIPDNAIAVLKEQEPVRPVLGRIGNFAAINDYTCPVCGTDLYHHQKYCDECGSEVKWDEADSVKPKREWENYNLARTQLNVKCPKCGKKIWRRNDLVLTSYPAQYKYEYECECGWVGYV